MFIDVTFLDKTCTVSKDTQIGTVKCQLDIPLSTHVYAKGIKVHDEERLKEIYGVELITDGFCLELTEEVDGIEKTIIWGNEQRCVVVLPTNPLYCLIDYARFVSFILYILFIFINYSFIYLFLIMV